ncbi:MAG: hypothetical protein ABL901_04155, partial [Hyphomicrobiaceae bacterium]
QNPGGISYTLAKAVLQIKVRMWEREARIAVCVSDEIPVMDDRHQYAMSFRNSPLSADTITVRTYQSSNILREINVTAIDQTDQFIINLAASAGAIAGAFGKKEADATVPCTESSSPDKPIVELSSVYVDPGNPRDTGHKLAALNEILMTYVGRLARRCSDPRDRFTQSVQPDTCQEYLRIAREFKRSRAPIQLTWKHPDVVDVQPPPDCSVGICYRARLTHMLTVDVAGARSDTQAFSFTNTSPLLAMDISRGIAITKTTKITFDPLGQPKSVYLRKGKDDGSDGAEAVELAKLPATVITGYFGAFNKSVGYVNAALSSQTELIKTQTALKMPGTPAKESFADVGPKQQTYAMSVSNVSPVASTSANQISKLGNQAPDAKVISPPPEKPDQPSSGGFSTLPKAD